MSGRTPPKRPEERLGHPKRAERGAAATTTSAPPAPASSAEWPAADPTWTERAAAWWTSLGESGQASFYQPSDIAHARVMAGILDDAIRWHDPSMYRVWLAGSKGLLTTELDRRLGRMELGAPRRPGASGGGTGPSSGPASIVDELAAARARLA